MRRPLVPPDQAAAVVRRNTWQGMAQARVPAAYPVPRVRLPRMLGGLKGAPAPSSPPMGVVRTGATSGGLFGPYDGTDVTTTAPTAGDTQIVFIAARGDTVGMTLTPPAGWTVMDSGSTGNTTWAVAILENAAGGESSTWDVGSGGGTWLVGWDWVCWTYTGAVGGTWEAVTGTYSGSVAAGGHYTVIDPDPAWEVWAQSVMIGGSYTGGVGPPFTVYGGTWLGSYSLPAVDDDLTPTPWTGSGTYSTSNGYRPPTSISLALGWRP